jgi:ornithine cyclodeaminase
VESYPEPYLFAHTAAWNGSRDLAALVSAGTTPARPGEGISLFCSAGLAGTEVLVAAHVLERHRALLT